MTTLSAINYDNPTSFHDLHLNLTDEDWAAFASTHPYAGWDGTGDMPQPVTPRWVTVTDQNTGRRWDVRAAACPADCYCAAEAKPA